MPGGRPPKLHAIARVRPDGTRVTVADSIVQALELGDYVESAAAAAGVAKRTVYGWLETGARLTHAQEAARDRHLPIPTGTRHERDCQAFSHAVARATEAWHLRALATLEDLGRGGREVRTVTTRRNAAGDVVEEVERVETLPPSPQVLEWRLTRRFPERYGQRIDVGVSAVDPVELGVQARAASLIDNVAAYLAGQADATADDAASVDNAG